MNNNALLIAGVSVVALGTLYLFTSDVIKSKVDSAEISAPLGDWNGTPSADEPSFEVPPKQTFPKQSTSKQKNKGKGHRRAAFLQKWLKMTPAQQEQFLKTHPRAKRPTEAELKTAREKAAATPVQSPQAAPQQP